jgi:hypothetical protein
MTDEQLEQLLQASRPAGPPPELRARIVAVRDARRAWPWVAAAAALLALTISLQVSAARELSVIRPGGVVASEEQSRDLADLIAFGLDDEAMQALALRQQLERRLSSSQSSEEPVAK